MKKRLPLRTIGAVYDGANNLGMAYQDHDEGGTCYAIASDLSVSWTGTPDEFNRRFRLIRDKDKHTNK